MGTLEHTPDFWRAARFLADHLAPGACVWEDFCAARSGRQVGAFLARYVWAGTAQYVDLADLVGALLRAGLEVLEVTNDTWSYALTCRDWADALDRESEGLTERFGVRDVRLFRVFLRASQHFLARDRVQAYHLVARKPPASKP